MMIRTISSILIVTACSVQDAASQSTGSGSITLGADTPVVVAKTRASDRSFMRLPTLDYRIDLDADCAPGLIPRSISLSVADTRKSLTAADISTETVTTTDFSVPASQIGPVAVGNFCVMDTEGQELSQTSESSPDTRESLTITSVVSLQVSLLCGNDSSNDMTYASLPLDVTLTCEVRGTPHEATSN